MPIEFRCTRCYTLLRTKDEAAGRQVSCPKCQETLTVPAPEVGLPGSALAGGPADASAEGGPERPAAGPVGGPQGEVNPYQAPESVDAAWRPPPGPGPNGPAIASLVLGICSMPAVCCCGLFGVPISVVGLILGIIGLKSQSRGLAVAGVVLSSIGLIFGLLAVLVFVLAMVMDSQPMRW